MQLIMGIDIGTSGVKVVVVDWEQGLLAKSARDYDTHQSIPGQAEQNPFDWLEATVGAIQDVDVTLLREVVGIAFAGQMHAVIPVDQQYQPLTQALLWFDSRARREADMLTAAIASSSYTHSPIHCDPTMPLAKIRWLRDHSNLDWSRVRYVLGAKDWLRCQFGGTAQTDSSEASGTQLMGFESGVWDEQLVGLAGLTVQQLPRITAATSPDRGLSETIALRTGLRAGCPLFVGGGDFSVAMGLFNLNSEDLVVNIGTSGQVARRTVQSTARLGLAYFNAVYGTDLFELVPLLSVGMALKWWQNISGSAKADAPICSANEAKWPPVLFLPQIAGERSWHPKPISSGGFWGLRAEYGRADLTQAVLQGVVLSIREACEALVGDLRITHKEIYLTGSGIFSRMIGGELSAALGQSLHIRRYTEPTAEGAAFLAWLGVQGHVQGEPPLHWGSEHVIDPNSEQVVHYDRLYPLYQRARELQSIFWNDQT